MICLSFSSAPDGVYYLKSNESSEIHPVYCQISSLSAKCGGGGWTLVMKLDKNKVYNGWHSKQYTNFQWRSYRPTFGLANASVFIDCIRNQFLKK